ncbi:hypothetical protein FOA52_002430 [Chlamydomonas sp. UWO 241]|nr:hypothetical protein FOA52_002430 [Chlamydomonas sp. UWO 241]
MAVPAAPVTSGTELIVAALHHTCTPTTCIEITDEFGDTTYTCGAVWASEDLLRVAAVSKELRAAAAADHLWEPLLEHFTEQHLFGEDGHGDCSYPVIPARIHGNKRDRHSLLLHPRDRVARAHVPALVLPQSAKTRLDEVTGDVVDKFHSASEDAGMGSFNECPTTVWLKRPPALMRCEPCGGLSFDCGRSFTEHCCSWKHHQLMLPPEERLPEELWDTRWNPEAFAALTPQRRYLAIHLHVQTVMAAIDAPVDEAGMQNMQEIADFIRHEVLQYEGISKKERKAAAARCTAEEVADAIREIFLIRDFCDKRLTADHTCVHDLFAGPNKGWAVWHAGGGCSTLASCVSGLAF